MTFDVVGFGALNLDKLYNVNLIAKEEEEGFVTGFKESAGGSAANTIVGLSRLKLRTGFIGNVASDHEGKFLLEDFSNEGVDTKSITIVDEGRSGVVMGFIDIKGDRALYVDPGVNNLIEFQDINLEYANSTEFLHLSSFVGEQPLKAQKKLLDKVPNAIETKILTAENYEEGAKTFIKIGAEIVAIKLGDKGCYVTNGKENHLVEPYKVSVVDTTGAGDAFCAGFLYGLIKGKDLYECGKLGNFVASRCITKMGARTGLPRLEDMKEL
jgi:ribokinase